jgi:hypothetical protein
MVRTRRHPQGSALIITLLIAAIIGLTILSYLDLTSSQNRAVMRSQQWNSIVPIMEAGVEEALTQLYYNSTNLGANNWTSNANAYSKTRYFDYGRYTAAISNVNPPVIYSTGYIRIPLSTGEISRVVRVATTNSGLFSRGLVAKGSVTFVGQNVTIDSFDSLGTNIDWNVGIRKANGTVGSATGSVSVQNSNIYGDIAVSPVGSASTGPNGRVGDLTYTGLGIQPGKLSTDLNISIPDVAVPAMLASAPPVPANNTIISSGNYTSLGFANTLTVQSNVVATVLVNGDINGGITLETGAKLVVYMNGSSLSVAGNTKINQATNSNALNLLIYGTSNFTSFSLSGNAAFKGMLYAPYAAFSCGGGGNNVVDFAGAATVSTADMNGHFNFHYDEIIGKLGPGAGFVVIGWMEL